MKKILIVEDEMVIAKYMSSILEKEGYRCEIGITTVEEAKNQLKTNSYDLVLIDIKLRSNSDGTCLGNILLEKDITPYIYVTASTDAITLERIKDTRPHGIIIKPFKAADITSTVSIVLNNYQYKKVDVLRESNDKSYEEAPLIIKNVLKYISNNIHEKIELHQLAKQANWSEQYLIKIFTQYLGCTPYQYILKQKIEKAKTLINETNISLTNIAFDLGFCSYSNFCVAFKKEAGKSPTVFRSERKFFNQIHDENLN